MNDVTERVRGRYDMPWLVKKHVASIAELQGISHSMAAALLLAYALNRYIAGEISFKSIRREPSESPKYTYNIPNVEIVQVLQGEKKL